MKSHLAQISPVVIGAVILELWCANFFFLLLKIVLWLNTVIEIFDH